MRPAFTLQNGDEIYEVSVCGNIDIVHVKQVKIDGLVVTARIVDERYRYNSNLIVGHKNSNIMVGESGIYYIEKSDAEFEARKNYEKQNVNNFLSHLRKLGIDVTISSQSLIEQIDKGIKY